MLGVIIGGLIAVLGGIAGQIITYFLNRKATKNTEKKNVYINMLSISHEMIGGILTSNCDICELLARAKLFGSDEVAKEFEKIKNYYFEYKYDRIEDNKFREQINAHINVMSSTMRKELKSETKKSKELYRLTIGNKK